MRRLGIRATTVFVHQTTRIPAWLEDGGARISLGHLNISPEHANHGPVICRVVIHSAQVNFGEKGSTVIRQSGSRMFRPLFPSGVVLAVTDPEGELVLNRHLCRACCKNTGRFKRDDDGNRIILAKGTTEETYQFHCPDCGFLWGVSFPKPTNGNGNGNGNGHVHVAKHQSRRR